MDSTPAASTIQNFGKNEACGRFRTVFAFLQKSVSLQSSFMDISSGMGISTTTDSSGYFLRLPGLLPVFIVPAVCFLWRPGNMGFPDGSGCARPASRIFQSGAKTQPFKSLQ